MPPLISIIIPFYGNADKALLDRCLHSIKDQLYVQGEYEVIIVDGENLGNARNKGIGQAKGKYLFFVDADDYLFAHSLEIITTVVGDVWPDIYSFRSKKVYRQKEVRKREIYYDLYPSGANFMCSHNIRGSVCMHVFRKDLIMQYNLRFREGIYHEDEEFTAKAYYYADEIAVSKTPLYAYYQQSGSITNSNDQKVHAKRIMDFCEVILELIRFMTINSNNTNELQTRALKRRISFLTIDYLRMLFGFKGGFSLMLDKMKVLKAENLLPLPHERYGWKYRMVRPVINFLAR